MTTVRHGAWLALVRNPATMLIVLATAVVAPAASWAQRTYDRLPVVKEGTTVGISPHVYVIPDERARGVPNVGIVVGNRSFFMALRDGVAGMKHQGKSSDETATTLRKAFRAQYPDWDQPLTVHTAAAAMYAELP